MREGKPYNWNSKRSGGEASNINYAEDKAIVNTGTRYPINVIEFKQERGLHPTQKPVALLEYLINTYTNEGDTVLDNCMGSGSTGVACVNTNREFIGMELDENYFNIAKISGKHLLITSCELADERPCNVFLSDIFLSDVFLLFELLIVSFNLPLICCSLFFPLGKILSKTLDKPPPIVVAASFPFIKEAKNGAATIAPPNAPDAKLPIDYYVVCVKALALL
jgi:hypothetical protein